jgi:hypothetical protein
VFCEDPFDFKCESPTTGHLCQAGSAELASSAALIGYWLRQTAFGGGVKTKASEK